MTITVKEVMSNHAGRQNSFFGGGGGGGGNFILGKCKWSTYICYISIYISQYILLTFSLVHNKNKLNKTLVFSSRDMPNFNILKERLGILFPPHLLHDF